MDRAGRSGPVVVADLPRGLRQAADHGHRHRHRLSRSSPAWARATTVSLRATSAGSLGRCWPTSPTRPAATCSSFVGLDDARLVLSIGWGLLILGILILRVRTVLHTGLMEAALEQSARDGGIGATGELQFCASCEMPLLDNAAFCNACGTAVRAQAKPHKTAVSASVGADQGCRRGPARRRRCRPPQRRPPGTSRRNHRPRPHRPGRPPRPRPTSPVSGAAPRTASTTTRRVGHEPESRPVGPPRARASPGYPPQRPASAGWRIPAAGWLSAAGWAYRRQQPGGYPPQQGGYPPQQGGYQQQGAYNRRAATPSAPGAYGPRVAATRQARVVTSRYPPPGRSGLRWRRRPRRARR